MTQNKKFGVTALAAALTMTTCAIRPTEAEALQLTTNTNWTSIVGETGKGGQLAASRVVKNNTNTITITTEEDPTSMKDGEKITILAKATSTNPNARFQTISWYVDGVMAERKTLGDPIDSFTYEYHGAGAIWCVFDGFVLEKTEWGMDVGSFSSQSGCIMLSAMKTEPSVPTVAFWRAQMGKNRSVNENTETTFEVTPSDHLGGYQCAWYLGNAGSQDGELIAENTFTLTLTSDQSMHNKWVRCDAILDDGKIIKGTRCFLNVYTPPKIIEQPVGIELEEGKTAKLKVKAVTGRPAILLYQWEVSCDMGGTWEEIPGAWNAEYEVPAAAAAHNALYRCRLNNTQYECYSRPVSVITEGRDTAAPAIQTVEGIPKAGDNMPVGILETAFDDFAAPLSSSFDGGKTWQPTPLTTSRNDQEVTLLVKDAAGNLAEKSFAVRNFIDESEKALAVSYMKSSPDGSYIYTELTPKHRTENDQFCFNYRPAAINAWTRQAIGALRTGEAVTVASKDSLGTVISRTVTPTLDDLIGNSGSGRRLIGSASLPCAGCVLGPSSDTGQGMYLDRAGNMIPYDQLQVDGRETSGVLIPIKAFPQHGGILEGKVTLSGVSMPLYWDPGLTKSLSDAGGTAYAVIDAGKLWQSKKDAVVQITITEYTGADKKHLLQEDTIRAALTIDITPPVISLQYEPKTHTLTAEANDEFLTVEHLRYRVITSAGESDWEEYTSPIILNTSSTVEVLAEDALGNVGTASTGLIRVSAALDPNSENLKNSYYYASGLFQNYLVGTGKKSLKQVTREKGGI